MEETKRSEGMLSPYRVLDLTDEKGLLCGKLLGDLGADVIKIEKPGGDSARQLGPFYHDEADPEKSLFWSAFNTSKRGITLDIEAADGQETFRRLARTADFVIESFSPGYLDALGLGYSALEELNPGIIMVSITPFGQTGPYRDYQAPDIVAWAMGGLMYQCGDADRPPVRISHHSQAYLHAAAEAAVGAMMALRYREMTGEGQQVDVSIQEAVVLASYLSSASWDMTKANLQRGGLGRAIDLATIWPCKDGYLTFNWWSGQRAKRFNLPFVEWLDSEGMADDFLNEFDWDTFDLTLIPLLPAEDRPAAIERMQETVDHLAELTRRFFMTHTKAELLEGSVEHHVLLYPVSTVKDILESVQLASRKLWVELEHPELDTTITYPGTWAKASEAPPRLSRRAPLIGEHNEEIFGKQSGLSREELPAAKLNKKSGRKNTPKRPLEGIKVADFTWAAVGPIPTKTLADYGAEVIRVESRKRPDIVRTLGPFKDRIPGWDRSGQFSLFNSSKLSVALNLTRPEGLALAKRFVARADIVVENFAGGVMERLGLDYEELKKIKPDIIMLRSCMQGHTGPHAMSQGTGAELSALSGFNLIAGWPDREPVALGPYTDFICPRLISLIILSALDYRRRTGKGQYIDMSQFEKGIQFLMPLVLDYVVNGRVSDRVGNHHSHAAPHNAYRCRGEDRWCAIAVFTDEEWRSFCKAIGSPVWTSSPTFATLRARQHNEEELDRLVQAWTVNCTAEEVMTLLQTAGVAAGVLETGEDQLERDPQLRHRHYYWELDHPEIRKYSTGRTSFLLSKSPCEVRRFPVLGEHNECALKEFLGMSDEEIAELVVDEVLE